MAFCQQMVEISKQTRQTESKVFISHLRSDVPSFVDSYTVKGDKLHERACGRRRQGQSHDCPSAVLEAPCDNIKNNGLGIEIAQLARRLLCILFSLCLGNRGQDQNIWAGKCITSSTLGSIIERIQDTNP